MNKLVKIFSIVIATIILLFAAASALVFTKTNSQINARIEITPATVEYASDPTTIAYGKHVYITRGCAECHGKDAGGSMVIETPPMGRFGGTNLTSGKGSAIADYKDSRDWDRSVRHGIDTDGRKLIFMPSHEMNNMSEADLGSVIAYIETLPPVDRSIEIEIGPLARVLHLAGEFPLLAADKIDHEAKRPPEPLTGATEEYGAYLAQLCIGCHGPRMSGGKIPGTPPEWPAATNISPDKDTGIGAWNMNDFIVAMREGKRPNGSAISEIMPWEDMGQMHDWELEAVWLYLMSLDAAPYGNR